MTKENINKIVEEFDKNLEERKKLLNDMQSSEMAIESLSKKPDVIAYLYLQNHLKEVQEKLSLTTDDICEYALNETYSRTTDEPYVWVYDYINSGEAKVNACREDSEGTHRVYLGIESLTPMVLTREAAFNFEQVNDVIVLEEYNNPQDCGLTQEVFDEYRKEYFTNLLGKARTK